MGFGVVRIQKKSQRITPPTVSITSPQDGSVVYEIVNITCISTDNDAIEKVELWVNGVSKGLIDNSEPYSFEWNTTTYNNDSYTITVRFYDVSGNTTDSESIILNVNNNLSIPSSSFLESINFYNGLQIRWSQYSDNDFQSYMIYKSNNSNMSDKTLLYETYNKLDTVYTIAEIEYYQITSQDIWGYQSNSNIQFGDYYVELWGKNYSVEQTTELVLLYTEGLTTPIPPEIGNLTNLTRIQIDDNSLGGEIPAEIGNLTKLQFLRLHWCELSGSIPETINNLTDLSFLNLSVNQLSGAIPESICDLDLDFSNSDIVGLYSNQLCPPYKYCIEQYIELQDTSNCN